MNEQEGGLLYKISIRVTNFGLRTSTPHSCTKKCCHSLIVGHFVDLPVFHQKLTKKPYFFVLSFKTTCLSLHSRKLHDKVNRVKCKAKHVVSKPDTNLQNSELESQTPTQIYKTQRVKESKPYTNLQNSESQRVKTLHKFTKLRELESQNPTQIYKTQRVRESKLRESESQFPSNKPSAENMPL